MLIYDRPVSIKKVIKRIVNFFYNSDPNGEPWQGSFLMSSACAGDFIGQWINSKIGMDIARCYGYRQILNHGERF